MKSKINHKKYLFIVANPLQILMSVALMRQLCIASDSALIIHDGFTGAKKISENFTSSELKLGEIEVVYLNSRKDAFDFAHKTMPRQIFIDGDVGARNFATLLSLKLLNRKLEICIFEEGIGTYRNDLYKGVKRKLFESLGIGVYFGGCILTSKVYVTNPGRYKEIFPKNSEKICLLKDEPSKTLSLNQDAWAITFNHTMIYIKNSNQCNIYLTNWNFDIDHLEKVLKWNGDHYVKLHPRCNDQVNSPHVVVLDTPAPAELIISDLSEKYELVRVFHHGSSVAQYFSGSNVVFIKL